MTFEFVLTFIIGLVVGVIIGYFGASYLRNKQLKSNPTAMFSDDMLKALLRSTGQTPNEKKLKKMRRDMELASKN